jgi:hypothetical protein
VSFGTVVIGLGFLVLLAWIPLRQWPGLGTISNAIVIGLVIDAALALLARPDAIGRYEVAAFLDGQTLVDPAWSRSSNGGPDRRRNPSNGRDRNSPRGRRWRLGVGPAGLAV